MRSNDRRTICSLLTGVGFAWLLGLSPGWAAPAPQALKGSAPNSASVSGPQTSVASAQPQAPIATDSVSRRIKALPKVANPQARKAKESTVIAELRAQRQVAEIERGVILSTQRMAPKGQIPGAMGASKLPPGRTMNNKPATGQATGAMQISAHNTAIATSTGTSVPGVAMGPCLRPTIITVNKQTKGTIFTPDPQGNLYVITGCMFGDQQGQAYIYGAFTAGQVALKIAYWTDKGIVATLDPQITGELDQSNVTLVVVPQGAAPAQKAGFKFYAVRETTLLTKFPLSSLTSGNAIDTMGYGVPVGPRSPGWDSFPGRMVSVTRQSRYVFNGGQDIFDFSKMRPGFTTESMALEHTDLAIRDNYQENGVWNGEWVGDNIRVSWQMQHFHYKTLDGVDRDHSESNYGLNVWVSGPRGVSPWPN